MRFSALVLVILSLFWGVAARAATPLWQVTEVAGPVRVRNEDGIREARRGSTLAPGDAVVTGAGGRAVLTRGEEYVIVSASSRLRLPAAAERSGGIIQMLQDLGTAVYKIQKKMTPHFGVQTPYLAAVVKGTTFKVVASPQGASVQVIEGRVEVAANDGGERRMVVPGAIAAVSAAQPGKLTLSEVGTAPGKSAGRAADKSSKGGDNSENGKKSVSAQSGHSPRTSERGRSADIRRDGVRADASSTAHGRNAGSPDAPRSETAGGTNARGAVVTHTPGERAVLVALPNAARNATPRGQTDPNRGHGTPDVPRPNDPHTTVPAPPAPPQPPRNGGSDNADEDDDAQDEDGRPDTPPDPDRPARDGKDGGKDKDNDKDAQRYIVVPPLPSAGVTPSSPLPTAHPVPAPAAPPPAPLRDFNPSLRPVQEQ